MTSRVYHGYQQDLSQLRSALPILPVPNPLASGAGALQRPQTPKWKRLVLTTLLKNRSRATECHAIGPTTAPLYNIIILFDTVGIIVNTKNNSTVSPPCLFGMRHRGSPLPSQCVRHNSTVGNVKIPLTGRSDYSCVHM